MKKQKHTGKLFLAINYKHNIYACEHHNDTDDAYTILPSIFATKFEGTYRKNFVKILDTISLDMKQIIIQIINIEPLSPIEIKNILGQSYSTIRQHIKDLENLGIVQLIPGIGKKKKRELKVELHPNVVPVPLIELKGRLEKELVDSDSEKKDFDKELRAEIKSIQETQTTKLAQKKNKLAKYRKNTG